MSLRALRTLVAIVRQGTFAGAAKSVGLTQSAVSLQVKALEEEFRVQLFDRSRRQPVLTEAGRILLARAEELLALYDRIPDALSDEQALAGRLRLGAIQTALAGPVPDALVRLRREQPRLHVHVAAGMSAELAQRVADGDLDAAVATEPVRPHPPGLVWSPLYEDRFWLLAPPEQEGRDPRDLLREVPFIRFDAKAWAGRMIARELRRLGLEVRDEMVLDSQEVIVRMVISGLGAAIVPLADAALPTLPPLARFPFGEPQLTRRVVLLERQDQPTRRFARAVADAVRATSMRNSQETDEI